MSGTGEVGLRFTHLLPVLDEEGRLHTCEAFQLKGEDGSRVVVSVEGPEFVGAVIAPDGTQVHSYFVVEGAPIGASDWARNGEWSDHLEGWRHGPACEAARAADRWTACTDVGDADCGPVVRPLSPSHLHLMELVRAHGYRVGWINDPERWSKSRAG